MTTPRLSFEPAPRGSFDGRRAYFNAGFFRGEWRRAWPRTVCYALLLFLILPLPLLFEFNSRRIWTTESLTLSITRLFVNSTGFYALAVAAIAIFAGMLGTRYLCRRPSTDFYHSLPLRREGLLLTAWLTGVTTFLAALLADLLLTLVILTTRAGQMAPFAQVLGALAQAAGYMLLTYLLFFTLSLFCGVLCGTSPMQVMLVGLVLGAYPLFRLLSVTFSEMFTDNIYLSSMIETQWAWTSPLMRLCYLCETHHVYHAEQVERIVMDYPFAWYEVVLWVLAAVLLLLGACLIYRRRRVERAGTPVVFDGVAAAVKWVVIVLGTMSLGWLFEALGGGMLWLFFGFALGALLSHLLINSILTKNPGQMFDGWRRLLIYILVFCLAFVGFGYALSHLEDIVPGNVKRVSIELDYDSFNVPYYEDPAVIEAWQALWRETEPWASQGATAPEAAGGYDAVDDRLYIYAVAQVGSLVIPYQPRWVDRAAAAELLRAMADSQEFEEGFDGIVAQLAQASFISDDPNAALNEYDYNHVNATFLYAQLFDGQYMSRYTAVDDMRRVLAQLPEDIDFAFFQQPVYASLEASWLRYRMWDAVSTSGTRSHSGFMLPVTVQLSALSEGLTGMDCEAMYGAMADYIWEKHRGMYVVRRVDGVLSTDGEGALYVSDRAQIIELLRGMAVLDTYGKHALSPFVIPDGQYWVIIGQSGETQAIPLIKGCVPAFVPAALG